MIVPEWIKDFVARQADLKANPPCTEAERVERDVPDVFLPWARATRSYPIPTVVRLIGPINEEEGTV